MLWGEPHSNIDGDYDLEFYPHQIKLDDFFFLSKNELADKFKVEYKPSEKSEGTVTENKDNFKIK